ncbi:hypothetical protein M422DRAFT_239254 [Sphaerobolus stellatus SS14]|nr:hypothetical protein M422DRAFT_239254 [Sphaerobolus stellatus SS14]
MKGFFKLFPKARYLNACSVTGSFDATLQLWNVGTCRQLVKSFKGYGDTVKCVSFSFDGEYIAFRCEDGTVNLASIVTGVSAHSNIKHKSKVNCISSSPNGNYIATASSYDTTVILWHIETDGSLLIDSYKEFTADVSVVSFSSDEKNITIGLELEDNFTVHWWTSWQTSDISDGNGLELYWSGKVPEEWDIKLSLFSPGCRYLVMVVGWHIYLQSATDDDSDYKTSG